MPEAIRVAKLAEAAAIDTKQSAHSLDRLGFFQYTSGDMKAGEASLRQALEIRRAKIGEDTLDYAESANDLALFCRGQQSVTGRQDASPHKPWPSGRASWGRMICWWPRTLNTLGSVQAMAGDYDPRHRTHGRGADHP
ncbi:MAG: tetratricopeptide repeat protein [Ignavibacteriota bacterium]